MKIKFAGAAVPAKGILVVLASEGGKLLPLGEAVDKRCDGQLAKAIKAAKYEAKRDSVLDIVVPGGGFDRVLLVGVGSIEGLGEKEVELLDIRIHQLKRLVYGQLAAAESTASQPK